MTYVAACSAVCHDIMIGMGILLGTLAVVLTLAIVVGSLAVSPWIGVSALAAIIVFVAAPGIGHRLRTHSFLPLHYGSPQDARSRTRVRNLLVGAWLFALLPALAQRFTAPRRANTVADVAGLSGAAEMVSNAVLLAVTAYALFVVATSLRSPLQLGVAALLLLPYGYNVLSTFTHSTPLPLSWVAAMAVLVALAYSSVRLENLAITAYLLGITAVLSLVLAVFLPSIGLMVGYSGAITESEKGILFPTLLAGMFNHSNVLGTMLILALPSVLLLTRRSHALVITATSAIAILWASSRTSIAALCVGGICVAIAVLLRKGLRTVWMVSTIIGVLVAVAVLPLMTHDLSAFSSRGQIWTGSLAQFASGDVLFGSGYGWYGYIAQFSNDLIAVAFNGHNLFVHAATTGGVAYLVILGGIFAAMVAASVKFGIRGQIFPYAFTITYATMSALEVAFRFRDLEPAFWTTAIPIAVILLSAGALQARDGEAAPQDRMQVATPGS
jgi:hypothetical protein